MASKERLLLEAPSKIRTGTLLQARHHITKIRNLVKVGSVAIGLTSLDTIKQPVYLRQGYGIFLRKFQRPRRDSYGEVALPRLVFHPESRIIDEYSGALAKTLCTPGVLMISEAFSDLQLGRVGTELRQRQDSSMTFDVSVELPEFSESPTQTRPGPKPVFLGEWSPAKQHLMAPIMPHPSTLCFYDEEGRKPPPVYFVPNSPLPEPEITSGTDSFLALTTDRTLLHMARGPTIHIPPSTHFLSAEDSETHTLSPTRVLAKLKQRRPAMKCPLPRFHVISGNISIPPQGQPVKLTSARVQPPLVDVGNVFPIGAEKDLLAEIDFYKQNNFPLLVSRNDDVDLKEFRNFNPTRMLPPERVTRVHTLTRTVSRQRVLARELIQQDEDIWKTGNSCLEDDIFNPLSYPFNEDLYKDIQRISERNKIRDPGRHGL